MRGHVVDEMSDNENDITSEIGRKGSRQHKGTSNFQKVTIFSFGNPILLGVSAEELWRTIPLEDKNSLREWF